MAKTVIITNGTGTSNLINDTVEFVEDEPEELVNAREQLKNLELEIKKFVAGKLAEKLSLSAAAVRQRSSRAKERISKKLCL